MGRAFLRQVRTGSSGIKPVFASQDTRYDFIPDEPVLTCLTNTYFSSYLSSLKSNFCHFRNACRCFIVADTVHIFP